LIAEVKRKRTEQDAREREIEWIAENWETARTRGASLQALADLIGMGSLWGRHGEGITYYRNARIVQALFHDAAVLGAEGIRRRAEEIKGRIGK
jgi:hypothetical protein